MSRSKIKSFTLSELLVVMIITAIVVGMAFSVLRLVQKQIVMIQNNYSKTANLSLFEQRLWQDFNAFIEVKLTENGTNLSMKSEMDSVFYKFNEDFILRNSDTIKLKLTIDRVFFEGKQVKEGNIDAISLSGELELPNYAIFVSRKNDVTFFMNQDGF